MASWLRAAEGFLEVVDRTAKQVVRETDAIPSASPESNATPGKTKKPSDNSALPRIPSATLSAKKIRHARTSSDDFASNGVHQARESAMNDKLPDAEGDQVAAEEDSVSCNMSTENGVVAVNLLVGDPGEKPKSLDEDQLSEANSLLENAPSGKSKEARLAKVCAGLSARLQELKAENTQLEELLQREREDRKAADAAVYQLQEDLALARTASSSVESELEAALSSKNAEIEALARDLEHERRTARLLEEKFASIQGDMHIVLENRELTETRMIQSLRQELSLAERRADEERVLHAATRAAAVERETELEQRMAESTSAVMRMQRLVDERSQKAADLEQKVAMLEVECATLNQELQSVESRIRREQKRQPEENVQAWREEAERARLSQREAERKLSAVEAEYQKLRVELASAKQDSDASTSQAHMELENRYRELTELLYLKQTQLETLASEKAAALFQLEKESNRAREARAELERNRRQFTAMGDEEDAGLRSFESLGLQHRRINSNPSLQKMVGPSIQTAAKFLDSGAVTAGRYLWRRPLARIFVVFYLLFVHLFLMYLLHRLQEQTVSSIEAALKKTGA